MMTSFLPSQALRPEQLPSGSSGQVNIWNRPSHANLGGCGIIFILQVKKKKMNGVP